jgi:signal transduction histidine kinase
MRKQLLLGFGVFMITVVYGQQKTVDSFAQILSPAVKDSLQRLAIASSEDTNKVLLLHQLTYPVLFSRPDSAMYFGQEGLTLARRINYRKGQILCMTDIGAVWWIMGDYARAEDVLLQSVNAARSLQDAQALEWSLSFLLSTYRDQGSFQEALKYSFEGAAIHQYFTPKVWNVIIGSVYEEMGKTDSALFYLQHGDLNDYNLLKLGDAYARLNQDRLALDYYNKAIAKLTALNNFKDLADTYIGLARLYKKKNNIDSAIYYADKGLRIAQNASFKKWVYEINLLLSEVYENEDPGRALYFFKNAMAAKDSMFNIRKITENLSYRYNEQLRQQETEMAKINYQNSLRTNTLLGVLAVFLLLAGFQYRGNRQKQKAKAKIESAYKELQATQAQLIQREKMASLGELTAGIAHEIKNPLNFVNNFSAVNKELIEELLLSNKKGDQEEVDALAANIRANEEKIFQHGQRADSIVKGMLQHAGASTGMKEPTDINRLVEEYMRLSYQGMRAKEKGFTATLQTHFDDSFKRVAIMPQEIGRVLLNLFNNAFYAINKKKQQLNGTFEPTVSVSTKNEGDRITIIIVKDNGIGIPEKAKDKIFQPFFTTKPTGEGTGLGLSLSYDIITKGHGGELKVESKEGEGAQFIVKLPQQ